MLGWEFPPYLTGGLGPACYGLAKALSKQVDLHIILPRTTSDSLLDKVKITGLNQLDFEKLQLEKLKKIRSIEKDIADSFIESSNKKSSPKQEIEFLDELAKKETEEVKHTYHELIEDNSNQFKAKEERFYKVVREETIKKIKEERVLFSYENFAVVDYVNISLDPYKPNWIAENKPTSKKVSKTVTKSSNQKVLTKKIVEVLKVVAPVKAKPPSRKEELTNESTEEKNRFEQNYTKAKNKLLVTPELEPKTIQNESNEKEDEFNELVAFDWAFKQLLFEDSDTYGPRTMEKVAAYTEAVLHYAAQQDFDIIHAHDWLTFPAAVALKKQTKKPLIVHVHSLETDRTTNPQIKNEVFYIEKKGMEAADKVIAVSRYTKNCIQENYGIDAFKIEVVYNGIEPLKPLVSVNKQKMKRIVTVGRVTPQKGIIQLIETASILLEKIENVHFLIAGVGDQLREAMFLARSKGISDKVKFLGFLPQDKVKSLLASADVFFMPSVSDPFGLAALEAAQFGVPLVLSKQTGAHEVLPNSLRANFWETEKFANYLYATLHYQGLREELKKATLADVENVRWENAANTSIEVYQKVIEEQIKKPQS